MRIATWEATPLATGGPLLKGASSSSTLWRARWWIFAGCTVVLLAGITVLLYFLDVFESAPEMSPPPAPPGPPPPNPPLLAGYAYVDSVHFAITLLGAAGSNRTRRRELVLANDFDPACGINCLKSKLMQQMPADVDQSHVTVSYIEPVLTGYVRVVPPVTPAQVHAVFDQPGFVSGFEYDTGYAVARDGYALLDQPMQWHAPSPPPVPPHRPPSLPPSPGLPPAPPPTPPPPPHSPARCPDASPGGGEFCVQSGMLCGFDEHCCTTGVCFNQTDAYCYERAWVVSISTYVCGPTGPPEPPTGPLPPRAPPSPPVPPQ
ncbi:MAG: hypothetical protein ACKVI4_15660, partial [Actinomycetales bacterium]